MRIARFVLAGLLAAPGITAAQAPSERVLTSLETLVACGPPPSFEVPADPLHVLGSQDPVARFVFAPGEPLVLDGGTARGVQLGQQYFIRRMLVSGADRARPRGIHTLGWLTIVALNEQTAIAKVDHFCDAITTGDYLEPFQAPALPPGADADNPVGEPDFTSLGRVLSGPRNTTSGAAGDLMLIDRGSDQSMAPGARFAVYRDLHKTGIPLASVGEGVVLSVGRSMSLTKITRSRDAIVSGDYIVPRK